MVITDQSELLQKLEAAHNECLVDLNKTLHQESGTLYHYTNLNSCMSILENETLRFTDIRYCNDPAEIEDGLKILNKIHEEVMPKYLKLLPLFSYMMSYLIHSLNLATSFDIYDEKLLSKAYEDLKKSGLTSELFTYKKSSIFVASLSERSDDLRQWMPYANDGEGVAIGFKGFKGHHEITSDDAWILRVSYESVQNKEKYARNLYDKIFHIFKDMDQSLMGVFIENVYAALLFDVIACKSENYKDEMEWRLISVRRHEENLEDLEFSMKNNNIIRPHVNVKISKDALLEVKLGPKAEKILNSHALKNALRKFDYFSASITESEIQYR